MQPLLNQIINKNFHEEVESLQNILRLKSVYCEKDITQEYPLGKNLAICLDEFLKIADSFGFKSKNIDNIVGYVEIGSGERLVGILAHLDTVPEGNVSRWITPPFEANIIDGNIYGRGTTDDKGPAIAALYAMRAIKESECELGYRIRLIVGLDEETRFRCIKRYLESEEKPVFSFSPDSVFPLVNGEKGIFSFAIKRTFTPIGKEPIRLLGLTAGERTNVVPDTAKAYFAGNIAKIKLELEELNDDHLHFGYVDNYLEVVAVGKSTHAMHPEKGVNAIQILFEALAKIEFAPSELMRFIRTANGFLKMETDGKSLGLACSDELSGKLTLNCAVLRYNSQDLVMKFDIRYPVTKAPLEMDNEVREVAKKLGGLVQIISNKKPMYIDDDNEYIKKLLKAYEIVTGEKGKAVTIGGGTYARAFPNAVSFGATFPNDPELAHEENEYISMDSLKKVTLIYAVALSIL